MTIRLLCTLTVLCWLMWTSSLAKRVLLMPFPTTSRSLIHMELAHSLMTRGHDVTLVLNDWISKKEVINTSGLSIIVYHTILSFENDFINVALKTFFGEETLDTSHEKYRSFSHEILSNRSLYEDIESVQADLFVFDDTETITKMFVVFPYKLGIPFACFDFSFQPFNRRIPFSPATVPVHQSSLDQHMNIMERLQNTLAFFFSLVNTPLILQDAAARYAPEKAYVPLDRLVARAEVWLIELDPILQFPYPTLPNVRHIGGLMATPPKPLDSQFQSFMDSAKHGIVVVSFGSMVVNFPENISSKLMAAFLKLRPMKVVFRANVTSPDNNQILTSQWLPQNSLLAHPNCRVFVSHDGISGHYQALYHAVPILGLPLLNDQIQNAKVMQTKGFGFYRDINKITAEELVKDIQELTENPRYKRTISRASELYRELYGVPRETAAYWLDHVMKYGGAYMRSPGQEMPLYQFLLLDVLSIFALSVVCVVALVSVCLRWVYTRSCGRKQKTE